MENSEKVIEAAVKSINELGMGSEELKRAVHALLAEKDKPEIDSGITIEVKSNCPDCGGTGRKRVGYEAWADCFCKNTEPEIEEIDLDGLAGEIKKLGNTVNLIIRYIKREG